MRRATLALTFLLLLLPIAGHSAMQYRYCFPLVRAEPSPQFGAACCLTASEFTSLGLSGQALNANDVDWQTGNWFQFLRGYDQWRTGVNTFNRAGQPIHPVELAQRIMVNPGLVYAIGNEPDQAQFECLTPTEYAVWYSTIRAYIRGLDPTARFCTAGIGDVTKHPAYLDALHALPVNQWPEIVDVHCACAPGAGGAPNLAAWTAGLDWQIAQVQARFPAAQIYLTEFWFASTNATPQQAAAFLSGAAQTLRARPAVVRAAYWPTNEAEAEYGISPRLLLLDPATDQPTALGQLYRQLATGALPGAYP